MEDARQPPPAEDRGLVLVVDDDVSTCMVIGAQLRHEGFRIVTAYDGIEAIELFERHAPDIVFLDVMLPDLYGFEVARAIKRIAGGRFVPVIFLTGLSEAEAIADCVEAGGDDFLHKPVDLLVLRAKVMAIGRIRDLYERVRGQHAELAELHSRMQFEQSIAEQVLNQAVMAHNVAIPPIRTWLQPASSFNGDLFISCHTPDGGIAVMLGDFTGHGLTAALGALPTSETFRSMMAKGFTLLDTLAEINRKLNSLLPAGIFLAAAALRIDPDLKTALAWNSGMPELLLCRGDGSRRLIASHHPPMGVLPEFMPGTDVERVRLGPGDGFMLCSDGLTEACNRSGEAFGETRFMSLLEARCAIDAFDALCEGVGDFIHDADQRDDISLVAIPCVPELMADATDETGWATEAAPLSPWQWSLRLEGGNLWRVDPVPQIISYLRVFGVPKRHLQQLYVVVVELFSNALDHGVLGLDSFLKASPEGFTEYYRRRQAALENLRDGFVELAFSYHRSNDNGILSVCVEDSGKGFRNADGSGCRIVEVLRCEDGGSPESDLPSQSTSGRGIRLIRSLCHSVRYVGSGNRVEAEYLF